MGYGYNPQNYNISLQNQPMQQVQPLFPQPQGNVYNINSTLEVANVPVGAGISVALCLQEGFMYIKTMQNGSPLFWAYRITPYDSAKPAQDDDAAAQDKQKENDEYSIRLDKIEKQINEILVKIKPKEEF